MEILVTVAISVAIVLMVGGLATGVFASNVHRQHATADASARSIGECLQDRQLPWNSMGSYPACASSGIAAKCWDAGSYPATFSNCPNGDTGLQQLTITATQGSATETLTVLKRRNP